MSGFPEYTGLGDQDRRFERLYSELQWTRAANDRLLAALKWISDPGHRLDADGTAKELFAHAVEAVNKHTSAVLVRLVRQAGAEINE